MAHNIQRRDIQTGLVKAWHGLTTIVKKITRENCGILYGMAATPVYYRDLAGEYQEANAKQIISLDDGAAVGAPVSKSYGVITNEDIWGMLENSLEGARHEIVSCGTVGDRTRGFISVKLDDAFMAADRLTESTLNFLWGHSGEMAVYAKTGLTVVVCQNTFNAAMGQGGKDFRFVLPHHSGAALRLPAMGAAIEAHYGVKREFQRAMEELANTPTDAPEVQRLVVGTIADNRAEFVTKSVAKVTNRITTLFREGAGNRGENLADAFNAATDFYSHEAARGSDRWAQFENSEFGKGTDIKTRFFANLTDPAARTETMERGAFLIGKTN